MTALDKESRKEIHQILKCFDKVDSNQEVKDGKKLIKAEGALKLQIKQWPCERPKYLHFTLYKENCETYVAISLLDIRCRTKEKLFLFAGTKDRRGRTTQRVSVSMVSAKQILGVGRIIQWVDVGSFSYQKNQIRLRDLSGNRFELGRLLIIVGYFLTNTFPFLAMKEILELVKKPSIILELKGLEQQAFPLTMLGR